MNSKGSCQWKSLFCLLVFFCGFLAEQLPVQAAKSIDTSDESYLLMLAATTRLTGEEAPPLQANQSPGSTIPVHWLLQTQKMKPNELRSLSNFYLDFAARLPADHPLVAHFTAKSLDNLEKANQLDRARRRRNNPFRRFVQAVTWPALKIARGVGWSVKKGITYLNEVGPEIIKEMLKGYLTNGTSFTAKVFWKAVAKRLKTAITNEATAKVAALLQGSVMTSKNPTPAATDTREITATETVSTDAEGEKIKYGNWMVTVEIPAQTDVYGYSVMNLYQDYPFDVHLVDPYEWAGPTGYWDAISFPLEINLGEGIVSGTFKGTGVGPESELVYERSTASFSANISQGWVKPSNEIFSWEIGGTVEVNFVAEDELRCWYNPDDPLIPGYFVWVPNRVEKTLTFPIEGLIYKDGGTETGWLELQIGGPAINDPDYDFYIENAEIALPADFPLP
jgi:hypothetical protein